MQTFTARTERDQQFTVWACDHDEAWRLADAHAETHRLGKVYEIRTHTIVATGGSDSA